MQCLRMRFVFLIDKVLLLVNQCNSRRRKIRRCKRDLFLNFHDETVVGCSVKGLVERIEENDDPKKRTSERASAQAKLPSDKV